MIFMNSKPPRLTDTVVSVAAVIALFSTCFAVALERVPSATKLMLPATRSKVISLSIGAIFFIFSKNLSEIIVGMALVALLSPEVPVAQARASSSFRFPCRFFSHRLQYSTEFLSIGLSILSSMMLSPFFWAISSAFRASSAAAALRDSISALMASISSIRACSASLSSASRFSSPVSSISSASLASSCSPFSSSNFIV